MLGERKERKGWHHTGDQEKPWAVRVRGPTGSLTWTSNADVLRASQPLLSQHPC